MPSIYLLKNLTPACYCRKSQESEDKQVLSIDSQTEEAQRLTTHWGIKNSKYYKESKSAKQSGERLVFKQMIADMKKGVVDSIVCWKLDRLARNMVEGGQVIDLLQKGVIKAIITPSKIYLPDENALLMAVEFGSANQFSRDLSLNVKRGQAKKASLGYPHGVAALGFTNDRTEEKGNRKWLVDKERFSVLKQLFEMYLTGNWSVGKLVKYARNTLQFTTPVRKRIGGAYITHSRMFQILKDPIYSGFFFYGGKRYELNKSLPRIISEQEYYQIQLMISNKSIPKTKNHEVTYAGYVKAPTGEFIGQDIKRQVICDCKHKFSYVNKLSCPKCKKLISELESPKYLSYVYYYNVSRRKSGNRAKVVEEKTIDSFFANYIKTNLLMSNRLRDWCARNFTILNEKEQVKEEQINEIAVGHKTQLEGKKQRLRDLLVKGILTEEEYQNDRDSVEKELTAMGQKLTKSDYEKETGKLVETLTLLKSVETIFNSSEIEPKRKVLSRLGSNLTWDEKYLCIVNKKPVQALIDGLSKARGKNHLFEPENILDLSVRNPVFEDVRPILLRTLEDVRNCLK